MAVAMHKEKRKLLCVCFSRSVNTPCVCNNGRLSFKKNPLLEGYFFRPFFACFLVEA